MEEAPNGGPTADGGRIEVRLENLSQLFDTLDPFPFPERDLDRDAEEFIVGWARELPHGAPVTIRIHLPAAEAQSEQAKAAAAAIKRFFDYRAGMMERELHELFRVGRIALLIGLVTLAACLSASRFVASQLGMTPFGRFLEESLIIVGWVVNWKPIEILLYDWLPPTRRRNLYRRLAKATVEWKAY